MKKLICILVALLMLCSVVIAEGNGPGESGANDVSNDEVEDKGNGEGNGEMNQPTTSVPLKQEGEQNQQRLIATLSNGRQAEVKLMPTRAAETAIARLRMKQCLNCTIELKEVNISKKVAGKIKNEPRLAYEIQIQRHARILGIFKAKLGITAQVDAENGEIIQVKKRWWAFLATEPSEVE